MLHGLHVVFSDDEEARVHGQQVLEEFSFRCGSLGVKSTTHLVMGDIAEQITERARWVDMVVINQRRVHGRWAERPLGTIFQTVAAQTPRTVLAVPGTEVVSPERVMLAYDGSPKGREALFVLRHIATCWKLGAVILGVEAPGIDRDMLDQAWEYIQEAGAPEVVTRYEKGPADQAILRVVGEERADMLLMGGYGYSPLLKAFLGSTLDRVLREAWFPVLICR